MLTTMLTPYKARVYGPQLLAIAINTQRVVGLRTPVAPSRQFSINNNCLRNEDSKQVSNKKQKPGLDSFQPRIMGVTSEIYVPTTSKNLPSIISHPIIVFQSIIRRIYMFGLNTAKIALFRTQSDVKPNFLLWKNRAIESYVKVNKAFAKGDIRSAKSSMSLWVEEALTSRAARLPQNLELEWDIVKFNRVPKLISFDPVMIPGKALDHVQLVYKFDTRQELVRLDKNTLKADKRVRDVVDYMVFLCDTTTNDVILIGSVFESKAGAKLPRPSDSNDKKAIIDHMRRCGDIFRVPPK